MGDSIADVMGAPFGIRIDADTIAIHLADLVRGFGAPLSPKTMRGTPARGGRAVEIGWEVGFQGETPRGVDLASTAKCSQTL